MSQVKKSYVVYQTWPWRYILGLKAEFLGFTLTLDISFILHDAMHKRGTSYRPVSVCPSVRETCILWPNS